MRSRWLPVLAGLLLFSACSDSENPAPTAPAVPEAPSAELQIGPPGCPTTIQLRVQLTQLFIQPGQIIIVNLKFTGIELAVLAKKTTLAQNLMFALVQYILDRYDRGELRGGKSPETQARVIALIKGLYCFVGLPEPNLSALALGPDGAAVVVQPSATDTTTVVTDTKFAGVKIPPGAVATPTLVTITRLPDFPGPLNTLLDQYPAFYEYTSSSGTDFGTEVIVGTCQVQDFTPPDYNRLVIAHNVGDGVELLPRAPAPFLDCTDLLSMRDPANGWFRYVSRGWRSLEPLAARLLLPERAYAVTLGTCCLGGSSKSFSPFGAVDPLTRASAVSPTSFIGLAATTVAPDLLPTIKVLTPLGRPVPGLSVTFSVPVGSEGSVTGATQTTNQDGIATLGGWTLGAAAGLDQVIATVTPIPGTTVEGNPVSFSAETVSRTPLTYLATGYRYLLLGSAAAPAGFELPGFTGAAGWATGAAAFGSGPGSPDGCALDATVHTTWPAASHTSSAVRTTTYTPGPSDLLVRGSFTVPTGWTAGAKVSVAIDNDVQVFVNGVNVTASAGSATLVNGFQKHEGCATRGSLVFTVPNGALVPGGANLVAVRARDRGRTSYFDMEVTLSE
jgi:hypothetical protein